MLMKNKYMVAFLKMFKKRKILIEQNNLSELVRSKCSEGNVISIAQGDLTTTW
jgi:hypothetical protein